jgi:hypothetical protein
MITSKKKRQCLLMCARKGWSLPSVNRRLEDQCLDPIHSQEWNLWSNYYLAIVRNDPYFEHELIDNNRSLAWFANEINLRRSKHILS